MGIQIAGERLLRHVRGLIKGAADAHADHNRRARIRARVFHRPQDEVLHALHAVGRLEHLNLAHVFAARALRGDGDMKLIAGHDVVINHGGGIIAGIYAIQRVAHHALAQIAVGIALTHALVNGLLQIAVYIDLLTHIDKYTGEAGVLADRHIVRIRDIVIFNDLIQNPLRHGEGFVGMAVGDAFFDVGRQVAVGFDAHSAHRFGDF